MKQTLILLVLLPCVLAHSWVHCMDYDRSGGNDAQVYNPSKCTGFGRGWSQNCQNTNNQFGLDCGYNHQNPNKVCPFNLAPGNYNSSYSSQSPMPTYAPGERICLAWPAKNHVAASCANKNIPDFGTKIYISQANPTADPASLDDMRNNFRLVHDFGSNPGADAYQAFQNCPLFCDNQDKALCTGCFTVPQNLQQGAVYSFFWAWAFNNLADTYTTCWEARISGAVVTSPSSAQPATSAPSRAASSASSSAPRATSATSAASRPSTSASSSAQTSATSAPSRPSTSASSSARASSQIQTSNIETSQGNDPACTNMDVQGYCKEVCGNNIIESCTCTNGDVSVECADADIASHAIALSTLLSFSLYLML